MLDLRGWLTRFASRIAIAKVIEQKRPLTSQTGSIIEIKAAKLFSELFLLVTIDSHCF